MQMLISGVVPLVSIAIAELIIGHYLIRKQAKTAVGVTSRQNGEGGIKEY